MPFAMTHLWIAQNLLKRTDRIKNPGQFILGALAPDAIHFRDDYNSDMKKASHLCVGDEKWGRLTNNGEWLSNVLDFLEENRHGPNGDFICGYCSHILADIENNIRIWTPFLVESAKSGDKKEQGRYHKESEEADYALYLAIPQREVLWNMLETSTSYDLETMVFSREIDKMKDWVLNSRYTNKASVDLSQNKYVTLSVLDKFIAEVTPIVENELFG